jgi:Yip1-like protein
MAAETAQPAPALERSWWLRAVAVLVAPRAVFASLRDDSDEAAEARQEPLTAIAALAGIAVVLVSPTFRRMLNDGAVSLVLIPVLAFILGALYATAVFWLGGGLLYGAARRLGGEGSWRRARHTLALAATPLALALVTFWPVRIAVYGQDLFRTGGDDFGRGDAVFGGVYLGFVAWTGLLVLVGVRTVHGWTWGRSAATVALAAAVPVLISLAASL